MGNAINNERVQLGARIRHLRKEQGLSQRTLSLMIGLDRSYLIAVEHDRRNITLSNIARIAGGLGVSLSELFEGVEIRPLSQQEKLVEFNAMNISNLGLDSNAHTLDEEYDTDLDWDLGQSYS